MRADAGFVLVGLALVGCGETSVPDRTEVATDTRPAAVPLRLAGPGDATLLVPVRLNGRGPYDFILDTGATLTCVDAALADSLGQQEARGRLGIGAGLQGEPGSIQLVEIDSIAVGSSRAEGLTGCTVDLGSSAPWVWLREVCSDSTS